MGAGTKVSHNTLSAGQRQANSSAKNKAMPGKKVRLLGKGLEEGGSGPR